MLSDNAAAIMLNAPAVKLLPQSIVRRGFVKGIEFNRTTVEIRSRDEFSHCEFVFPDGPADDVKIWDCKFVRSQLRRNGNDWYVAKNLFTECSIPL